MANLTFSHTLRPSGQQLDVMLFDRLRDLTPDKQKELFEQLGRQAVA
ncbi:Prophage PssSM-01 [Pseudomonas syringae pv. maculicola]|nr:Prophage PssSM-01 [Pseudomonas syringae pv. maculicola]